MSTEPHGIPRPGPGATMEEYVASWFFEDNGGIWCRVCGCKIHDGWQADHYKTVHGFKGF
jgi:hypothetical protein